MEGKLKFKAVAVLSMLVLVLGFARVPAAHAELTGDTLVKVEKYKKKLTEWAREPAIIAAIREANAAGGIAGMTNSKWDGMSDTDPEVARMFSNTASQLLKNYDQDVGINKLYLRDKKGNIVAGSNKPLLYSIANRPAMVVIETGKPWAQGEVKPDPTTQVKSVQLAVPVFDGGIAIGVLHTGVTIE